MAAWQPSSSLGVVDLMAAKLVPSGQALIYSTYLGGTDRDIGGLVAVDAAGDAYVGGSTIPPDFPLLNAFQTKGAAGKNYDAIIAKLSGAGALLYSTYLGGQRSDQANGIA